MLRAVLLLAATLAGAPTLVSAQARPVDRAALSYEHSSLTKGNADWDALTLQLGRHWSARQLAELELTETRRFDQRDTELAVSGAAPLSSQLTGSLRLHGSPTHRVLPHFGMAGSLQYEFAPGWLLHGGLRHAHYTDTDVNQLSALLERYVGAWSFLAGVHAGHALGEDTQSAELRANWYYGDRSRAGIIVAAGEEATQVGPATIAIARVHSVALGGRHALDGRWALRWGLHHVRQGDFYTRSGLTLGLERDF